MLFSIKTKESIKTALAMTIAYGIALQMNWDNPHWAGFAVAFISLSTIGQSLNKGAMRMLGTLVAAAVALTLIALFPQDRWLFMLFLSIYVGFCTYMMGGKKRQYFWMVCGFVCVIICMGASDDFNYAFDTALLRAEETGLGILVYSLVSVLLWPNNSHDNFNAAVKKLAMTQYQLYQLYSGRMSGQSDNVKQQTLKIQIMQQHALFNQQLDAAESDTYDVWELRKQWRHYQYQAMKLTETMGYWHESIIDLEGIDIQQFIPDMIMFNTELNNRLDQINNMLADKAPDKLPVIIDLEIDKNSAKDLSHFQKAALTVFRDQLQSIEQLTRSLFNTISDIKSFNKAIAMTDMKQSSQSFFIIDLDRLANVVQIMVIMWLSYLAVIYIDGIPGGATFVTVSTVFGMVLITIPQASVTNLIAPVFVGIIFASLVYIFVLPQLSGFLSLGLLIFAVTFLICLMFAKPQQALGRAFGLALFVMISSISNDQTYNFLIPANTAMMFPLVFLLLAITAYVPHSPHPEHVFLRLSNRFFRNGVFLLSNLPKDRLLPVTKINRWMNKSRTQDLASLPKKLGFWAKYIDTKRLPGTTSDQVQSLVVTLQILAFRIQDLLEIRRCPQSDDLLKLLSDDAEEWRTIFIQFFNYLSKFPANKMGETLRIRLNKIMDDMEEKIKEALDHINEEEITISERENFYRLLGAYRSVSDTIIICLENAEAIDWKYWRQEKFA